MKAIFKKYPGRALTIAALALVAGFALVGVIVCTTATGGHALGMLCFYSPIAAVLIFFSLAAVVFPSQRSNRRRTSDTPNLDDTGRLHSASFNWYMSGNPNQLIGDATSTKIGNDV